VNDAMSSVILYEQWQDTRDPLQPVDNHKDPLLLSLRRYNEDDVVSTAELHTWLEIRRRELEDRDGPMPRQPGLLAPGAVREGETTAQRTKRERNQALEREEVLTVTRLRKEGHDAMADLLPWHRREARAAAWDGLRLRDLDEQELLDTANVTAGLSAPQDTGTDARSRLYTYTFPSQELEVSVGDGLCDVDTGKGAGTVHQIDRETGLMVVKRQGDAVACRALYVAENIQDAPLRASLAATAQDLLAGRYCLSLALLDRLFLPVPRPGPVETDSQFPANLGGHVTPAYLARLADDLLSPGRAKILAVQGPPGTGKTWDAAILIRHLLDQGKTVGVTANSHAVVLNLLKEVNRPALHKGDRGSNPPGNVVFTGKNPDVADAITGRLHNLIGGTPWLWCDPQVAAAQVDVLFVDEAGQMSLANALAVARAATALVLLGDPQQLRQPTRASHPGEAGRSALDHVLDGAQTLGAEQGLFLDVTYRMHPKLSEFVGNMLYEGRLKSAGKRERQRLLGDGPLVGSGLRVLDVPTKGRAARSPEEASAIARLWHNLQGREHICISGHVHRLRPKDVVVVVPFNAQVKAVQAMLPDARVGTVDKFQGQQAPVVIYGMTSSTVQDAPRGVGFLFDLNRLNVAVSRAKTLAVVVMSPTLADAPARSTQQLRQVNAVCRLREVAEPLVTDRAGVAAVVQSTDIV